LTLPADNTRAAYYVELDLMVWAKHEYGPEFAKFLRENYQCTDVLFRLAEHCGVVLMHGGGFGGPDWSVRVSLANLAEDTYPKIGRFLKETAEDYVKEWEMIKNTRIKKNNHQQKNKK
jgi:aspartate 4-decarboxylase